MRHRWGHGGTVLKISRVKWSHFPGDSHLPVLLEPAGVEGTVLSLLEERMCVRGLLEEHGALLCRGFSLSQEKFGEFIEALWGARLGYVYRSTPRKSVGRNMFTASLYPANREIPLHSENAYAREWPLRLGFFCAQAASIGGATPLADLTRVTKRIGPELVERFRRRGVRYIRNYHVGVDLPWTEVFQTHDRHEVEKFCRDRKISVEWGPQGTLRTIQVSQGTAIHPDLEIEVWFNQVHLFHVSGLGSDMEKEMIGLFGAEGVPRNAYYGDGENISPADLERIRAAFADEAVTFQWRSGDVLLLDNMRVAHGRHAYVGNRSVLVAMSQPYGGDSPRK